MHGDYTVLKLVKVPLTYPLHTKPPGLRQRGLLVAEVVTIVVNTKKNADHLPVTNEVKTDTHNLVHGENKLFATVHLSGKGWRLPFTFLI